MSVSLSRGSATFLCPTILLVLFAGQAAAQGRVERTDGADCAPIAERYVNERLAVWQQRLTLQDWSLSILMSRRGDLKPKTLGNIRWDTDTKRAVIRVLSPAEYQDKKTCGEILDDMEFTVVHELIHLELVSLPRSEASRRREEHAVNRIADALLRLDRKR